MVNCVVHSYYRLSLKVHPDRVAHDQVQDATQKFQVKDFCMYIHTLSIQLSVLCTWTFWQLYVPKRAVSNKATCIQILDTSKLDYELDI